MFTDETISESLNAPIVRGNIEAVAKFKHHRDAVQDFKTLHPKYAKNYELEIYANPEFKEFSKNIKYYSFDWTLYFYISSSDARYNPGRGFVHSYLFDKFVLNLQEALEKMRILMKTSFEGTYSKKFPFGDMPTLEVTKSHKGEVILRFWLSSGTHSFCHTLNFNETEKLLNEIVKVPEKGNKLVETLKQLSF